MVLTLELMFAKDSRISWKVILFGNTAIIPISLFNKIRKNDNNQRHHIEIYCTFVMYFLDTGRENITNTKYRSYRLSSIRFWSCSGNLKIIIPEIICRCNAFSIFIIWTKILYLGFKRKFLSVNHIITSICLRMHFSVTLTALP